MLAWQQLDFSVCKCCSCWSCCLQIFVPAGNSFGPQLFDVDTLHGGSAWGAGTFAGATGARQPSQLELDIAEHQVRTCFAVCHRSAAVSLCWLLTSLHKPPALYGRALGVQHQAGDPQCILISLSHQPQICHTLARSCSGGLLMVGP